MKILPRIYMASKVKHAEQWKLLRSRGHNIISTWIDEAGQGETVNYTDLWLRCVREASTADLVIVYAEPFETLKGALVEVGAALANNVHVFAVGARSGGTWYSHPLVTLCDSIDSALTLFYGYWNNRTV